MILRLVKFAVLLACAYFLWVNVDWREAWELLRRAEPGLLLLAVLVLTVQTLLSAERWRITAMRLGIQFPFRHAVREYYLAQVVNQSLPGGVVGDAGRAVRARDQAGVWVSSQAVIFERLAGQMGLLAVVITGLAIGVVRPGQDWSAAAQSLNASLLGICAVVLVVAITILRAWPTARQAMARPARPLFQAVLAPEVRWRQALLSLSTAIFNIAAFALCAQTIGVHLGALTSIILIPLVLFAMLLPLSIGGWGLREGAAVVLFPLFGATAGEGLAASVAFGLMVLLSVVPGFVLAAMGRNHADPARQNR